MKLRLMQSKRWSMWLCAAALGVAPAFAAEAPEAAPVQAQQAAQTCTGTVFDELGDPAVGASVIVKGTSIGVSTNMDGEFTLANVKLGSTIVINSLGCKPVSIVWNGQPITVHMEAASTALDEVVVVGYGVTQKRSKVTNSIAKVSEDVLTIGANADPAQALVGAVSGVKVKVTSGDPGATPSITVRGGTTFDGSGNDPVVVVDGQIRSSLSDINPNDIESLEILKDAGATALYGARASNGVLIVTTKQGKAGTSRINFSAKYGISNYRNSGYDFLNARDYIYWMRNAYNNTSWASKATLSSNNQPLGIGGTEVNSGTRWNILTATDQNMYLLDKGWELMDDPVTGGQIIFRDTDPCVINMQNAAQTQDYNLSFSGGNDKGQYYASLGYYDADGAFKTTFYKRYNFSFTGGYKVAPWLEANSIFNYTRAEWNTLPAQVGSAANFFGRVISVPHTIRLIDEEGNPVYGQGTNINVNFQPDKFLRDNSNNKFSMTQSFTAKIINGLTLKGSMAWYYEELLYESFNYDYQSNDAGNIDKAHNTSDQFQRTFNQTYNLVANYNRTFAEKHSVNAMLGMECFDGYIRGFKASGYGSPSAFQNLALTTQESRQMSSSHEKQRILSYFGRVEYDYMDKYLVAATFREDGYSRLQNNRWGFFPGASAGWVFSQEDFWKNLKELDWLNYGKLRASVGLNGNATGISAYGLQGSYGAYRYVDEWGYRIATLPNPNLKWEKTRTFEVGLTLGFLQNRFNFDITYYDRLTMDKYASLRLPSTTGFSTITTNNGEFRNRGVEMDFNGTLINAGGFRWNLGVNLTYNKNVVVKLPDNGLPNGRYSIDGFPLDQIYTGNGDETKWVGGIQEGQEPGILVGYKKNFIIQDMSQVPEGYIDIAAGSESSTQRYLYHDQKGLDKLAKMGITKNLVKLEPGDVIWQDMNGDGIIDTHDRAVLGHRTPHWTGGFNTTLSWKGLQLYARFDMGFDFSVYDGNLGWYLGCAQGAYNATEEVKDTWTPENPGAKYPRYTFASQLGTDNWIRRSDILTESGAYLACRELQLSYTLPMNICSKFACKGLSVSVTGQNLGYLKKTTVPLPDNQHASNLTSNNSGNGGTYNLPRTVLFGLNLTF